MFVKKAPDAKAEAIPAATDPSDTGGMAIDTLAGTLRSMGEYALDQEGMDAATFRHQAEAWAQHLTLASPPPGAAEAEPAGGGRRDWQGIRRFVRDYFRSSAKHATSVASDLRDVIWVFIRNFSRTLAADEQMDERIRQQMERLEQLVERSAPAELKREVMEAVGQMTQAFEERRQHQRAQMAALDQTVRTLGDQLETVRREGEIDPLTKVFNRKAFDVYLERTVEMFQAFRHDMCLMVIDVDHFKRINDSRGHAIGDQVLRAAADAIVKVFLRKSDFVARFGGDEFAVILRETALQDALSLAERLLGRVRALEITLDDQQIPISFSIGVAHLEPGDDPKAWFERADRGLYASKSAGRDRASAGG
jgi:diguanylate cyclase (GGDEF)-like protein